MSCAAGGEGWKDIYLVDVGAGTLRPLDVPHRRPGYVRAGHWGPHVDEFLWFVDYNCGVRWAARGTFEKRRLDCAEGYDPPTNIRDEGFPDGWLRPGRMAMLERSDDLLFLHVSLDYGSAWQKIPVSDEEAIPDTLRQLG